MVFSTEKVYFMKDSFYTGLRKYVENYHNDKIQEGGTIAKLRYICMYSSLLISKKQEN